MVTGVGAGIVVLCVGVVTSGEEARTVVHVGGVVIIVGVNIRATEVFARAVIGGCLWIVVVRIGVHATQNRYLTLGENTDLTEVAPRLVQPVLRRSEGTFVGCRIEPRVSGQIRCIHRNVIRGREVKCVDYGNTCSIERVVEINSRIAQCDVVGSSIIIELLITVIHLVAIVVDDFFHSDHADVFQAEQASTEFVKCIGRVLLVFDFDAFLEVG